MDRRREGASRQRGPPRALPSATSSAAGPPVAPGLEARRLDAWRGNSRLRQAAAGRLATGGPPHPRPGPPQTGPAPPAAAGAGFAASPAGAWLARTAPAMGGSCAGGGDGVGGWGAADGTDAALQARQQDADMPRGGPPCRAQQCSKRNAAQRSCVPTVPRSLGLLMEAEQGSRRGTALQAPQAGSPAGTCRNATRSRHSSDSGAAFFSRLQGARQRAWVGGRVG